MRPSSSKLNTITVRIRTLWRGKSDGIQKGFLFGDAEVRGCGTCMDAGGIEEGELIEGSSRSTMDEPTRWTLWADRILVF